MLPLLQNVFARSKWAQRPSADRRKCAARPRRKARSCSKASQKQVALKDQSKTCLSAPSIHTSWLPPPYVTRPAYDLKQQTTKVGCIGLPSGETNVLKQHHFMDFSEKPHQTSPTKLLLDAWTPSISAGSTNRYQPGRCPKGNAGQASDTASGEVDKLPGEVPDGVFSDVPRHQHRKRCHPNPQTLVRRLPSQQHSPRWFTTQ